MKISKTMLGGAALLGMAGIASAQNPNPVGTDIYVTGSSAFRATAITEISNLLGTNGVTTASDNATLTSANVVNFYGGKVNNTPVTIKVSFSGSGAGIQTVAQPSNTYLVGFLPDNATGTANPDPRTNTSNPRDAVVPDMAFSDVFQGTTPFNGTFMGTTYASLFPQGNSSYVGVVAFTFAASKGFPASQTMTSQVAQQLFSAGELPLSFFTGTTRTNAGDTPADGNTGVFATGRDADSGTRLTAAAETNIGVNTALQQYLPTVTGGASTVGGTITNLAPYPKKSINGVSHNAGDGGESSGGGLRVYLTDTLTQGAVNAVDSSFTNGGYLVTYLGMSDFNSVAGSGAVQLAYDGVMESPLDIEQGAYTFWSYEHLYYKSSLGTGNSPSVKLNFATSLANIILNSNSIAPNVPLGAMQVSRSGDGGVSSLNH